MNFSSRYEKSAIEFRVGSSKYDSGGQVLETEDVIYHENYTGSWDYDIAVVRVKQIRFNQRAKPIPMATKNAQPGLKVEVSGWGDTEAVSISTTFQSSSNFRVNYS